ncbi:MAG: tyrosine-type recombinase/integrase [Actinobacteria bacterium]|nr:tyrosine-type recombinase/integrase [Actinomycetota bacterium]
MQIHTLWKSRPRYPLGLSKLETPYLLRHSAITNVLEAGASRRKVQDLARHSDPRTTMHYDRNRTSLDDHAVHSPVAFLAPEYALSDVRELGHDH